MKSLIAKVAAAAVAVTIFAAPVAQAQYPPECGPGLVVVQIGGP